jgi:hypothetical protein
LPNVTQIRTSRDFSRDRWDDVRQRWTEHCSLSLLAAALGLTPSKDVFLTTAGAGATPAEEDAEQAEALMAILSCGPVGIGDGMGQTDRALVNRLCLEDGTLVQPDMPALPVERILNGAIDTSRLLAMQTRSTIGDQTWRYILTLNVSPGPDAPTTGPHLLPVGDQMPLAADQGRAVSDPAAGQGRVSIRSLIPALAGRWVVYDALHGRILGILNPGEPGPPLDASPLLAYTVLAPLRPDGTALIGDVSRFVCASGSRIASVEGFPGGIKVRLRGPAKSALRLAVYDTKGVPVLEMPGVTGCMATGGKAGLWEFSFHLPGAGAEPADALVRM